MNNRITKILIANRGEIALRVIRTAKEMGISTVAIYSDFDRLSPHVQLADEAVCLGSGNANDTYLNIDKIIQCCKITNADAIHPGYGFLSENASFAERIQQENIIFIGPSPSSIKVMGDKLTAKNAAKNFNVPLLPGSPAVKTIEEALIYTKKIGFPLLVKASAGGGGKGMRVVFNEKEFEENFYRASSEAKSAFGNETVFLEKFIEFPRHIEFQILGDQHNNVIHLFDRECSIQRRHQKVIEEAPSPALDDELRSRMAEAAINAAKSCDYYSAGTVEFILDENNEFFFLEMNTRLQVEHPVTELITGIDLVREQINIANGEKLGYSQDQLKINGHAMEFRVYAEDPDNNFLPNTGKITNYDIPSGPGIRVDDGIYAGLEISTRYDPMIAKLSIHHSSRSQTIERAKRAINEYKISGLKTTLPFCYFTLNHPVFISGNYNTKFIETYFKNNQKTQTSLSIAAISALLINDSANKTTTTQSKNSNTSNWKRNRTS